MTFSDDNVCCFRSMDPVCRQCVLDEEHVLLAFQRQRGTGQREQL